jgi:hypothetical protein
MDDRDKFLLEIQKLHVMMEELTLKYNMHGEVVNIMLTGILDYDELGEPVLKAVYSLDVDNEDLLQEAFDFLSFSYTFSEENDDLASETWYRSILDDFDDHPDIDPSCN